MKFGKGVLYKKLSAGVTDVQSGTVKAKGCKWIYIHIFYISPALGEIWSKGYEYNAVGHSQVS